jgi:hypothetical protein
VCDIDLEPCEVWKETKIGKARKAHKCDCCHGPIRVGEPYTKLFTVYEGDASSEKSCSACDDDVATFQDDHTVRGVPSYMPELYQQCVQDSMDEGDAVNADKYQQILKRRAERGTA